MMMMMITFSFWCRRFTQTSFIPDFQKLIAPLNTINCPFIYFSSTFKLNSFSSTFHQLLSLTAFRRLFIDCSSSTFTVERLFVDSTFILRVTYVYIVLVMFLGSENDAQWWIQSARVRTKRFERNIIKAPPGFRFVCYFVQISSCGPVRIGSTPGHRLSTPQKHKRRQIFFLGITSG